MTSFSLSALVYAYVATVPVTVYLAEFNLFALWSLEEKFDADRKPLLLILLFDASLLRASTAENFFA